MGNDPAARLRKGCGAVRLPGNLSPPGRSEAQTKLIRAQLCEGFLPAHPMFLHTSCVPCNVPQLLFADLGSLGLGRHCASRRARDRRLPVPRVLMLVRS